MKNNFCFHQERNPDFVISDEYKTKSKQNSQDENYSESAKNKSVKLLKDVKVRLNSISNSLKPGMGILYSYFKLPLE